MIRPKPGRRRGAATLLAAHLSLAIVALAGPGDAQERVRITPDPIGATRALVGVRSTGDAMPPLPVEALAPAPRTTPRSALPGTGVGMTATRALPLEGESLGVRTRGVAPTTASVEAGPIWSGTDAKTKCPSVIRAIRWGGQHGASTCGCRAGVRSATVNVQVGSLDASQARERCTAACGQVAWTGQWWTTLPG
ncbi:MAG: hypothetical protein ABFS41_08315, partial [Myxococcota bacterium]